MRPLLMHAWSPGVASTFVRLDHAVRPSFFVSYARRHEVTARAVEAALRAAGSQVWLDVIDLTIGNDWRRTIAAAIQRADEMILLICNASAASAVVRDEVDEALRLGKRLRPLVVEPLTPEAMHRIAYVTQRIHYLDIARDPAGDRILGFLEVEDAAARPGSMPAGAELEVLCVRRVWPPFGADLLHAQHMLGTLHARLERLLATYSAASALWLNAGLVACLAGAWERGLSLLATHAGAANTLAGWYFLALHLPRRGVLHRLGLASSRQLEHAADRASALGDNPLVSLLQAFVSGGCTNRPRRRNDHYRAFIEHARRCPEQRGEYLRFHHCLGSSATSLGEWRPDYLLTIKDKLHDNQG